MLLGVLTQVLYKKAQPTVAPNTGSTTNNYSYIHFGFKKRICIYMSPSYLIPYFDHYIYCHLCPYVTIFAS